MRRHELSDAEWALVQPLLPQPVLGRPRLDDRTVLNGIVWKFRTGGAWRADRYGSWASLHTRFRRWAADGTFERMLQAAQAQAISAAVCSAVCRSRSVEGGLLGGLLFDLGCPLLGLRLEVGLGRQRLHGLTELFAGVLDLLAQLLRSRC